MRLYYSFVTGVAGWLGLDFYQFIAKNYSRGETVTPDEKKAVILILLFMSWGINQIINDYLGLKEDKINAPNRPMAAGELNPYAALTVSGLLLTGASFLTYFYLEPIALIPFFTGILLNIVYEYSKNYGILANIVFGVMITMCCLFGFLAAGPTAAPYFTQSRVCVLILVATLNALMTYYTYFKDYIGDKIAGKKTLVVMMGLEKSRNLAYLSSLIPTILYLVFYYFEMIEAKPNNIFIFLGLITFFIQIRTGYLYYKFPAGEKAYFSLRENFRACICGQAALISLFNTETSMILFIASYVFVGFIFELYSDSKS